MIAFIADIHGNLPALQAVLEALGRYDIDQIYSLGDVAGYYPLINECIELLRDCGAVNILGNHDNYLANGIECPRSASVNKAIAYQRSVITKENLLWLKNSPGHLETDEFFAVHGGIHDYLEEYTEDPVYPEIPQKLFLCGHTHKAVYAASGDRIFCNPGSVGQPRDNDRRASYAVYSRQDGIILYRTEYDISYIAGAAAKAGFTPGFYNGLYTGKAIGQ